MTASGFLHSRRGSGARAAGAAHPLWARWNGELDLRYTLGVEEELMLLDPGSWALAQSSDRVLERLSVDLAAHASPETHASVIELATGIHTTVDSAVAELASLRGRLAAELGEMGLVAAAAGTHPLSVWRETRISGTPRYHELGAALRVLARREPTMALHVHIGVPAREEAVALMNGLRQRTPLLLALSGNSPFWQGRQTGFASARTLIFRAFPRTGLPRVFENYDDYVDAIDPLIAAGAIPDPGHLWWDVRLQPALGTVELRVMDAQSTVGDVAALVALVQSMAALELEDGPAPELEAPEVLEENCFLAARDGMDARLIDSRSRQLVAVAELVDDLVAECRPYAAALGCAGALARVPALAAGGGACRQLACCAREGGVQHVPAYLAGQFAADPRPR